MDANCIHVVLPENSCVTAGNCVTPCGLAFFSCSSASAASLALRFALFPVNTSADIGNSAYVTASATIPTPVHTSRL